jgi:glycosyltransferase involved in cell wall biosynthesis
MLETNIRSMRLLFDLQACQTQGSAHRGVGRYSKSLFLELAKTAAPREIYGLASDELANPVLWEFPEQNMVRPPRLPDWGVRRDFEGGQQDALDAALYAAAAAAVRPDVVHVSHLFEGYADRVAIPNAKHRPAGQVFSATLYDLIPMRFSDQYFHDKRFQAWYFHRVQWLRQADLLLSISESSRQDAINILGLDPSRIVTIHGGIGDHFQPINNRDTSRAKIMARYNISRPKFVLYTGGDDYRKNLQGAIEGYAALPQQTKVGTQLVIVCALEPHRKILFEIAALKAGLSADDIVFVGYVPESDLVALYGCCDLFIFPSLYEGLGLPVIEAMACGAPVIGSDNSSIKELIGRADAMFDATKAADIAKAMHRVLENSEFEQDLRQYSKTRSRLFNWKSAAATAIEAFDEALARKRVAGTRAASSGWLKRSRIAMMTPLPPVRSGIADYNARFLPFLAEHFDIDLYIVEDSVEDAELNAAFRIFPASEFAANAQSYDTILYEFGNSEFHVHMLNFLEQFPGVVGLHDAYLSGLFGYLQFNLGEDNRYVSEMLASHSGQARSLMAPLAAHPNAYGAAMVELPCTKRVLNQAIGLISHSSFNLEIARRLYPEGWPGPYRIIPQMVPRVEADDVDGRAKARADLGFAPDDFLIATFGHIAWTKCGDRLLDAFLNSVLASDKTCHLIFAGELAKDDFGEALGERIQDCNHSNRIKITGFLSEGDYSKYLRIADIAIQLRTKSRGGTPKGVLDCLAYGVPVIVNNEASYQDYPDDVVVKLSADPSAAEIADRIIALKEAAGELADQSLRGLAYVHKHHDPRYCAEQYAAAIHEFIERDSAARAKSTVHDIATDLAGCPEPGIAASMAADFIDARPIPDFARPRIVIDASHIANSDHGTGIPRVMRETVKVAYCEKVPGFDAVAVRRLNDDLVQANAWLATQGLLLPFEHTADQAVTVRLRPGDHLLMLDSSWAEYDQFAGIFAKARASRVPITTAVYDLLPLLLNEEDVFPGGKPWFERWLATAINTSDNLVCISRAVADELIQHIMTHGLGRKGLRIGYWHLGSSFPQFDSDSFATSSPKMHRPYALMVGTIEPRKNHFKALDAFERLWNNGSDLALVIAGRTGWLVDDFVARVKNSPQLNKKLFFRENICDAEIAELYRGAEALLFVSKGEGFGLPLVEAAHYGIPVICSDIPVFREIAGDHATYLDIKDADTIASGIADWQARKANGRIPLSTHIPRLTWAESANELFNVIRNNKWYWEKPS